MFVEKYSFDGTKKLSELKKGLMKDFHQATFDNQYESMEMEEELVDQVNARTFKTPPMTSEFYEILKKMDYGESKYLRQTQLRIFFFMLYRTGLKISDLLGLDKQFFDTMIETKRCVVFSLNLPLSEEAWEDLQSIRPILDYFYASAPFLGSRIRGDRNKLLHYNKLMFLLNTVLSYVANQYNFPVYTTQSFKVRFFIQELQRKDVHTMIHELNLKSAQHFREYQHRFLDEETYDTE